MNPLAITVGVILFPGLVTTMICDKITVHSPKWGSFKYSIYSFVFGVLCYALLQVIYFVATSLLHYTSLVSNATTHSLSVWTIGTTPQTPLNLPEVWYATALAPVVAGIAAWTVNHKILNAISNRFRISDKYGDENLYSYFLNSQEVDWVYVRDISSNVTYRGQVVSFSENDSIQEIVLAQVTVFSYDSSTEYYCVPLLYLAKPAGTFVIEAPQRNSSENINGTKAA